MMLTIQFSTLLAMFGTGIAMAWVFDVYTWFRDRLHFKRWMTFILDVLYWIVFAITVLLILYSVNQGRIRLPIFFMLLLGGLLYFQLLSMPFLRLWELIVTIVMRLAHFLWRILQILLIRPITWIFSTLFSLIFWIGTGLWKVVTILFAWLGRPFIAIYRTVQHFVFALIQKLGKMVIRLLGRNPKDE